MSTKNNAEYQGPDTTPKAFRYRDRLNAIEEMIVDALPDITRKLISMAKDGDLAAARYLYDRMAGRPSRLPLPPSIDKTIPYTGLDWSRDLLAHKDTRDRQTAAYMRDIFARESQSSPTKPTSTFPGIGAIRSNLTKGDSKSGNQ